MRMLLTLLLPAAALAWQSAAPGTGVAAFENPRPTVDALQAPAWARPGESLSAESLSASINGQPAEVLGVKSPADDLMLLVVLDLTDDLAAVEQARSSLIARISEFPANHFVGVLKAQNGLGVLTEPTANHDAVAAAIRSQPVGGRAGLLNTIERTARIGGNVIARSGVRLAILYLTDSDIGNYRENYDNAVVNSSDQGDLSRQVSDVLVRERISRMAASLAATRAPVFISHLTYRNDQLNVAYQTGLLALATATGGTASIARSVAEIPSGINQLVDLILQHYSVELALPDPSRNAVDLTLETKDGSPLSHRSSFVLPD